MNKEFKKIAGKKETRYVLESASAGATSAAAVATGPTGKKGNLLVQGKDDKPVVQRRNPVSANVNAAVGGGGAGAHKDKTKTIPRKEKHKKDWRKEFEESVNERKVDFNFDSNDIKRLEKITDLETLKAQAFDLIQRPSKKPMKPEKVEWFKNVLSNADSRIKVVKLMYDLLLSGEGHSVIGNKSSTNPNYYRQRFGEEGVAEGDYGIPDIPRFVSFYNKKGQLVGTSDHNGFHFTDEYYQRLRQDFERAQIDQMASDYNVAQKLKSGSWTAKKDMAEGWGMGGYATYAGTRHGRGVAELDSHYIDQENDMTASDLKSLYKQAVKLRNLIQKMGNSTTLEPWQQAKIAKAADYVNAVFKNLDNEYGLDKVEEKIKGSDGKACWKGYRYAGTKNGKDRCVKVGEEQINEGDYDLNYEIDNPDYNEEDPTSPEYINVGVNYSVFGEYRAATWNDPPEYPELEILKIVNADTGEEITDPETIKKIEQYVEDDVLNAEPDFDPPDYDDDDYFRESNENKKGLWANIHARKKKGLPSRKPGEKGAPSKKSWDTAVAASKKKQSTKEETHDKLKIYYFYNVPAGKATDAFALGLKRSKEGKWYSVDRRNAKAEFKFGNGKKWSPAVSEKMMPAGHFAGTPKNKLGPAAHLKGKMNRPARQGDLVGGAEENYSKKKTLKKN